MLYLYLCILVSLSYFYVSMMIFGVKTVRFLISNVFFPIIIPAHPIYDL